MEERYRLVFRGEVLDGHHAAVVKKKLGETLKITGDRLESLFAGKPVVIRRDADSAETARYQLAFKKAGARLRLMPVETADDRAEPDELSASKDSQPSLPKTQVRARPKQPGRTKELEGGGTGQVSFGLAPVGEDLLRPSERHNVPDRVVAVDHLSLAPAGTELSEPTESVSSPVQTPAWTVAPEFDRLSNVEDDEEASVLAPDWSVAPPGERLATVKPAARSPVDPKKIDFPLAPVGTRLQRVRPPDPPPPDTSHLSLED